MKHLKTVVRNFFHDEEGATAVEYGVMVALIIAAVVVIVALLGNQIEEGFQTVSTELSNQGLSGTGN